MASRRMPATVLARRRWEDSKGGEQRRERCDLGVVDRQVVGQSGAGRSTSVVSFVVDRVGDRPNEQRSEPDDGAEHRQCRSGHPCGRRGDRERITDADRAIEDRHDPEHAVVPIDDGDRHQRIGYVSDPLRDVSCEALVGPNLVDHQRHPGAARRTRRFHGRTGSRIPIDLVRPLPVRRLVDELGAFEPGDRHAAGSDREPCHRAQVVQLVALLDGHQQRTECSRRPRRADG